MAFFRGSAAYHPGAFVEARLPGLITQTRRVLTDLGVAAERVPFCCGYPLHLAGYEQEFREQVAAAKEAVRGRDVLTNDPYCARALQEALALPALTVLALLDRHVEKLRGKRTPFTYYHCAAVETAGVTRKAAARVVHKAYPKAGVVDGGCLTGGGEFSRNSPEVAAMAARAAPVKGAVVTACPHCLLALRGAKRDAYPVEWLFAEALP